jgi:hypothetical protein
VLQGCLKAVDLNTISRPDDGRLLPHSDKKQAISNRIFIGRRAQATAEPDQKRRFTISSAITSRASRVPIWVLCRPNVHSVSQIQQQAFLFPGEVRRPFLLS